MTSSVFVKVVMTDIFMSVLMEVLKKDVKKYAEGALDTILDCVNNIKMGFMDNMSSEDVKCLAYIFGEEVCCRVGDALDKGSITSIDFDGVLTESRKFFNFDKGVYDCVRKGLEFSEYSTIVKDMAKFLKLEGKTCRDKGLNVKIRDLDPEVVYSTAFNLTGEYLKECVNIGSKVGLEELNEFINSSF